MSDKPNQDDENAPTKLRHSGAWIDYRETEQSAQTDPAATLAAITDVAGVNFWREFVKQYAAQQNYSDERTRLLEDKAHEAIKRYEDDREGAKLRLVSHIDGMPIDDPVKRQREAFWMLTNAEEFNAFLEAVDEPARWHDPSKPEPEAEPVTSRKVHKVSVRSRTDPLDKPIQLAIDNAGGLEVAPATIWTEFLKLAESENPPDELTGVVDRPPNDDVKEVTVRYFDSNRDEKTITRGQFSQRISRRKAKDKQQK